MTNIILYVIIFVMAKQEKKSQKGFFKHNSDVIILIIVAAFGVLFSFFQVFKTLDYRFYDTFLNWSSEISDDANIVLIDIDDTSLNEIGSWPWTRDIIANVLIRMRELEAYNAVFDIEYLSPSTIAVDENISDITQNEFGEGIEKLEGAIGDFAEDIASRKISVNNVKRESANLISDSIEPVLYGMYQRISDSLHRDNDLIFGQAIQFFGNASMTINTRDLSIEVDEDDLAYAENRFLFSNVLDSNGYIDADNERAVGTEENSKRAFIPAYNKIIKHAKGAGFTNVVVDGDGSRRRVELLNHHNGKYTGQLSFAPLMRMLDVQYITREKHALNLIGVKLPGKNERKNIKIPLDLNGNMIINWLHGSYGDTFKHSPVYNFYLLIADEAQVVADLTALYNAEALALDEYDRENLAYAADVLEEYYLSEEMKADMLARCRGFDIDGNAIGGGIADEEYENYYALRNAFFDDAEALVGMLSSLDGAEGVPEIALLAESIAIYREDFEAMHNLFKGAFCIIGNSATGSTDLGTMPFQNRYPNMGTHANVANTILQEDFISEINPLWAIAAVFIIAVANILISRRFSAAFRNIHGVFYVIVPTAIIIGIFVLWKIYIPIAAPLFVMVATYLGEVALNFAMTNADKNTLRRGFDAYVAPEVVSQIVKNPGLLGLGGMNKHMTALFSDVQKFSAFTEQINKAEGESHGAVRLVEILNGYLGVLSDAIMDCRGTIDKYVGDEIVSFFGAPIDNPNHAFDSCVAGIRMKQAEDRYNEEHYEELPLHPKTGEPFLLKSRVGCNTGDMVVGNMGTEKKLNYTIMGNNVNLASRLEGTNKEYDSWIMAAESTWKEANTGENEGKIIVRQLDCVKVINVEKPVQIYSVVGLRSELPPEEIEAAEIFNKGMEWYMKGYLTPQEPKDVEDFKKAVKYFEQAHKCLEPRFKSIKEYVSPEGKMAQRCYGFLKNGLPLGADGKPLPWDGVFTMATK